ncbi:hypothetical protein [Streptomyces sp. NPDC059080]|uniref:hypothetical protein n=1 Tax=Streptomyces sp. NPDC059080 TaxID=3346718 RepID=UPI00368A3096
MTPGTGKSEVVTAVVATAVAAGQTVLVATTNNESVRVVAERYDAISPGLLMRTGNKEVQEAEAAKLERLLARPVEAPARGSATVAGDLRIRHARAAVHEAEAARLVGEEARLLELLRERARRVDGLGLPVRLLGWVDVPHGESALGGGGRSWRNAAEAEHGDRCPGLAGCRPCFPPTAAGLGMSGCYRALWGVFSGCSSHGVRALRGGGVLR